MHACTPPPYHHTCWHALRKQIHAGCIFTVEVIIQSLKIPWNSQDFGFWTPPFPPPYPKKSQPKGPSSAAAPGTAPLRSLPSTAASPARCARGRAKAAAAAAPTPRGGQFHRCRHRRSPWSFAFGLGFGSCSVGGQLAQLATIAL